ncbi:MATH domain-containing protein [Prochlorococcus sp. MIT 1223]|uniref:MATH domain-containing protein n=1 Tax=Prochlorococcus sp. MIT 1223 TaxID=3096217 RepID=UPI002A74FA55|nr:MATH domain-containing protein [Prochlorococcus sp. MIT 1223]
MQDLPSPPTSISHRELSSLLSKAYKDKGEENTKSIKQQRELEEYKELIDSWKTLSKELLSKLEKKGEYLAEGKDNSSIMALGAMEVHLNMALQALKASERTG